MKLTDLMATSLVVSFRCPDGDIEEIDSMLRDMGYHINTPEGFGLEVCLEQLEIQVELLYGENPPKLIAELMKELECASA